MPLNSIVAVLIWVVLLVLNNNLRSVKFFIITCVIFSILFLCSIIFLKLDPIFYSLPISYLILYQPLRIYFNDRLKRDPILYIRSVQLNLQEKSNLTIDDYIYSFLVLALPFVALALTYFLSNK
jgi:hypothetical protein